MSKAHFEFADGATVEHLRYSRTRLWNWSCSEGGEYAKATLTIIPDRNALRAEICVLAVPESADADALLEHPLLERFLDWATKVARKHGCNHMLWMDAA